MYRVDLSEFRPSDLQNLLVYLVQWGHKKAAKHPVLPEAFKKGRSDDHVPQSLKGNPMSALEETLSLDWLYPNPEALVPFIGNHDQVRIMAQPGATSELVRLGFGLVMTLRGMPELYAGDEIGMEGGEDPDNRRNFPGGFAGDAANAFLAAGRTATQSARHDWVAALGKLRSHSPTRAVDRDAADCACH